MGNDDREFVRELFGHTTPDTTPGATLRSHEQPHPHGLLSTFDRHRDDY